MVGGAVVRALAYHQCGPGSIPVRCHMWVEFSVGSLPCSEGFSPGSPVFLLPQKTTLKIPIRSWMHVHVSTSSKLFGVTWLNKLHLHFFIYIYNSSELGCASLSIRSKKFGIEVINCSILMYYPFLKHTYLHCLDQPRFSFQCRFSCSWCYLQRTS